MYNFNLRQVGGVYNANNLRFDHHQKTFEDTFSSEHNVRLSSAGLIYKHYGREIVENVIKKVLESMDLLTPIQITPEIINIVYLKIYDTLIKSIDAIDNGVNQYATDVQPLYRINTSLNHRIMRMNVS